MTQTEKVLRHMKRFGSITPLEAMEEYGIMRLGAQIWDLKREGHLIQSEDVKGRNRFGEPTRYAKYRLIRENLHEATHP